jgi:hypothetical protein
MARRTQERHQGAEAAPQGPAEKERPFRLGLIVFAIAIVIAGGLVVYMFGSRTQPTPPPTSSQASNPPTAAPTQAAPSIGPGVPATTYNDFAALPPPQQQTVMQQAIDHYDAVLGQAYRTLDPSLLPTVATGAQLQVVQQSLQKAIQNHQPESDESAVTILHIVLSPRPYSFVSIDIQATETAQYLDPKTLAPVGSTNTSTGRSSFSFVIQDGVWKVSEHIQEPTS